MRYLTTYIAYGILTICIKKKERLQCFGVHDAVMSGFPAIPGKNRKCVPIPNATALIGKNPVRVSKRG
jgi:hypothetical protein